MTPLCSRRRRATLTLSALGTLLLLLACPGRTSYPLPPQKDAAVDGGQIDAGPPPLRTLGDRPLFGSMPLANRFLDPQFVQIDAVGWMVFYEDERWAMVKRLTLAPTPTAQPALALPPGGAGRAAVVAGVAKSVKGPLQLSVWVGRSVGIMGPLAQMSAAFVGLYPQGDVLAVDLGEDASAAPFDGAGYTWNRLLVRIDDGPLAWGQLVVTNSSSQELLITSPVLIPVEAIHLHRAGTIDPRRSLRPVEARAWAVLQEGMRDRLGRWTADRARPKGVGTTCD